MKLQLLVTKPVTIDLTLNRGSIHFSHEPQFEPLIIELGRMELVGQDTDGGWGWEDFFHYDQLGGKGDNSSKVTEIRVINTNMNCGRITLELVYDEKSSTIVILKKSCS